MRRYDREVLAVALLNTRFRLIKFEVISQGILNEALAHPREILKPAIIHSASAFVVVHNHPSGDSTASDADLRMTRSISAAANVMHIQMLDHVIIGAPADGRSGYFWEELKKRNFMHAKRQSSSETTHVIEATIGHLREKFSSRFHEAEAVSNVRKFPFLKFSPYAQRNDRSLQ